MNNIESFTPNTDPWQDYDDIVDTKVGALKINGIAIGVIVIESYILPAEIALISAVAWLILFSPTPRTSDDEHVNNRKFQLLGYGLLIGITLVFFHQLGSLAILPIFQGMCHYSSHLQFEGLTHELINQKYFNKIKEMISQNNEEDFFNPFYLLAITNEINYPHYSFFNSLSLHEIISPLLEFSYRYKKIISFGSASIFNSHKAFFYYISKSIKKEIEYKHFEISVNYLIQCKKIYQDLDESFINTQLLYLGYASALHHLPCHLSLKNGMPVIIKGNEFGDISELKQKLIEAFGTVVEIN